MRTILLAAAALLLVPAYTRAEPSEPRLTGTVLISGFEPQIVAEGLAPGVRIRVHILRMFTGWEQAASGNWVQIPKPLHAWGDFVPDAAGTIDLNRTSPLAGTYAGIDSYGLLWSGRPINQKAADPFLPVEVDLAALKDGESRILLTRDGIILSQAQLRSVAPPGLHTQLVAEGRINGAFAAPADGKRHPVVILLHGSEGGDRDGARVLAERFAGQGFAAFALNYFAWDLKSLDGVPNAHVNQPIELIGAVRDWIAKRPEADISRIGLYGHSKGAEYAEAAAVYLPWIQAVAACVPTDVVWQGYGIGDERNRTNPWGDPPTQYSSFSWKAKPLPYVPLEGDRTGYYNNTAFYEAKRAEHSKRAKAARIPVERARASFLWLGGGRDAVWASGAMARALDRRMDSAGAGDRSELYLYETAGHDICGDGTYPTRLWTNDARDPRAPDLDANGRATVDGWNRVREFFRRKLGSAK